MFSWPGFGSALFLLFASYFSAPRLLMVLSLTLLLLSLLITFATLFWKISVHMVGLVFCAFVTFGFSANFLSFDGTYPTSCLQ